MTADLLHDRVRTSNLAAGVSLLLLLASCTTVLAQEAARERAESLLARKAWVEALEASELALREDPEDPVAMRLKAEALSGLERWDEAVSSYEEALSKFPPGLGLEDEAVDGLCRALLEKARFRFERGEPFEALDAVNTALVWNVDLLEGILERSRFLEALGRKEEAWSEIKTALEKAPRDPEVLYFASRFHILDNEYEKALPYLDRLLAGTDPPAPASTESWACLTSGKIRLERGERGLAWKHLRRASMLDPDNEEAASLFRNIEDYRTQAARVVRAERWLLLGSIALVAVYVIGGLAGWMILAKKELI